MILMALIGCPEKLSGLLKWMGVQDDQNWTYNVFNFLLLLILVLRCAWLYWKDHHSKYVYLLPFVFPQFWYIFSYLNDDALPLFISFIIVEVMVSVSLKPEK